MNLFSVGISHQTAELPVRERMWLSDEEIRNALVALNGRFFSECMVVSTCNRTEIYGVARDDALDPAALKEFLIALKGAGEIVRAEHFFVNASTAALNHLFKVAAGVDSMVIGDIQILNQVKEAFNLSRELQTLGPVLNRLMQASLHVGKRIRAETAICEGAVSVSYAAVELASKIFADLSKKSALLIGAGETGELTLKHLAGKNIGQMMIANRTREKAEHLVASIGGTVVDYDHIVDALCAVDIVITSVQSPSYVVQPEDVQKVMKERSHNPLFIIDIGVPRNVDPAAKKIENVFLYDIDSLGTIVDRNIERRRAELPKATRIIREEMVDFLHWHNSLQVGPTIQEFREALEKIRHEEVDKNINRFKAEDRELVELLTKRIVNKILHQPTTTLKHGAENGGGNAETLLRVKALRELFGISGTDSTNHEE